MNYNTINNENCNNIKIIINKINKINTNPKINLNFIKKYNNKQEKEIDNNTNDKLNINERYNLGYKTEKNSFNTFRLVKVDKLNNKKNEQYRPLITNYCFNSYKNDSKQKLSDNYKILKFEKFDKINNKSLSNKFITSNINIYSSNPSILIHKRNKCNKRNYSYKEIKNLSNNKKSNNYIFNNNIRKNEKSLTIETSYYANNNKFKKIPVNKNSPHKERPNHIYFESKSISNKKIDNQRFNNSVKNIENRQSKKRLNLNNIRIYANKIYYNNSQLEDLDNKINSNKNIYYSEAKSNTSFNNNENNWKEKNILGKNVYRINASFNNNVYCSNFEEYNNLNIHY